MKPVPPKPYLLPACAIAAAVALGAVHALSFQSAMHDVAAHPSVSSAHWQAFLNDMLVGIPVAAATGWATAYTLTGRGRAVHDSSSEQTEDQ